MASPRRRNIDKKGGLSHTRLYPVLLALLCSPTSADTLVNGLFSGTVPSRLLNLSWHTERERSSNNISDASKQLAEGFGNTPGAVDTKKNFVVFLSGAYAVENGHISERLLTWLPEDSRASLMTADVGNKDCSVIPLYLQNDQKVFIAVANLLREDDEVERICFLYGVRTALNLSVSDIGQFQAMRCYKTR
jgi:hypothetical protein